MQCYNDKVQLSSTPAFSAIINGTAYSGYAQFSIGNSKSTPVSIIVNSGTLIISCF